MYCVDEAVYRQIRKKLLCPEQGGILGVDAHGKVTFFYHDVTGVTDGKYYCPNVARLNNVIVDWAELGIAFIGFVHTHKNKCKLSTTDLEYAKLIKNACHMSQIIMMVYVLEKNIFFEYVI